MNTGSTNAQTAPVPAEELGPAYVVVEIDGAQCLTDEGVHTTFAEAFGFSSFYGRNWDAWIDLMSRLNDRSNDCDFRVPDKAVVCMFLKSATTIKEKAPKIWEDLNECTAFVNWRLVKVGEAPFLALSFYD
ncbi:MAG: barstar family protein [Pseudomonadota bacterium]